MNLAFLMELQALLCKLQPPNFGYARRCVDQTDAIPSDYSKSQQPAVEISYSISQKNLSQSFIVQLSELSQI